MPDVRGSPALRPSPLVPGMWKMSVPKFVPTSGGMHSWSKRVRPTVPSRTRVGESVHVVPTVASLTLVSPTPDPSPKPYPPAPPLWGLPSHMSDVTVAFIWLYFPQTWAAEPRL